MKPKKNPKPQPVLHGIPDEAGPVCVIIGSGISLTFDDINEARDRFPSAYFIVIQDAYVLAPWADTLYFCDYKWINWHYDSVLTKFAGEVATIDVAAVNKYEGEFTHIACVDAQRETIPGLCPSNGAIHHGYSSGYQAMHIARNRGFDKIVLLGMDYGATGRGHFFGSHPDNSDQNSDFRTMVRAFNDAAPQLAAEGVRVINCTPQTALQCFPRMTLAQACAEFTAASPVHNEAE